MNNILGPLIAYAFIRMALDVWRTHKVLKEQEERDRNDAP